MNVLVFARASALRSPAPYTTERMALTYLGERQSEVSAVSETRRSRVTPQRYLPGLGRPTQNVFKVRCVPNIEYLAALTTKPDTGQQLAEKKVQDLLARRKEGDQVWQRTYFVPPGEQKLVAMK